MNGGDAACKVLGLPLAATVGQLSVMREPQKIRRLKRRGIEINTMEAQRAEGEGKMGCQHDCACRPLSGEGGNHYQKWVFTLMYQVRPDSL